MGRSRTPTRRCIKSCRVRKEAPETEAFLLAKISDW
jgi:hypothetical protein